MLTGKISGHLVKVITQTLRNAPVNWRHLFRDCGIREDILQCPDHFVSSESVSEMLARAVANTGDEYLCLRYYDDSRAGFYENVFGALMRFAANIEELKNLYGSYAGMNERGSRFLTFGESLGYQTLEFHLPGNSSGKVQLMDLLCLYSMSLFRKISGRSMPIKRLDIIRSEFEKEHYIRHFGSVDICAQVPIQVVYLDMEVNQYQFAGRNPTLLKLISSSVGDKLLTTALEDEILQRLRTLLINNSHLNITSEMAATELGMSRSSLYRRLKELGTDFQRVHDDVRFQTAQRLLRNSDMPFWEISGILGFSTEANFFRFFRRMGPETPRKFRKRFR